MASNTYTSIAKTTLTSDQTTITFNLSGIDSSITDLVLINYSKCSNTSTGAAISIVFNSDTSGNYSQVAMEANGTSITGEGYTNTTSIDGGRINTSNGSNSNWGMGISHIKNYKDTNMHKSVLTRSSAWNEAWTVYEVISAWRNTAAITSLTITCGYNFLAGSTFELYGIASAPISPKATGGAIYSDAEYYYHVFGATGTFTPLQNLTCDYLVIAGGGGGGSYSAGGGGGAGGLRSTLGTTGGGGALESALSLTSGTAYTITVGAGGAGAVNTSTGVSGGTSSIAGSGLTTISTVGGGYGGGYNGGHYAPASGGSGGGAQYYTYQTGASGTANQGYAGGNGYYSGSSAGGGGGGAGGVGANATSTNGGNGGPGVYIPQMALATGTGVNSYYAGGGGGTTYDGTTAGTGGSGGGGNAAYSGGPTRYGTSGIAGTGSGGGAARTTTAPPSDAQGGNGGSGVVIVRYLK
jgi:hypothetical protein